MATLQTTARPFQTDYAGSPGIGARSAGTKRDFRFRYGYICRLIDDNELEGLPVRLRARTRSVHKASYWKSVSLLRRDAESVLRLRREKMAANQQWDFEALVGDYARVHMLLARLTIAGVGHSMRVGAGLESARKACVEFEGLLSAPSSLLAVPA
jgi:hypothetical protein